MSDMKFVSLALILLFALTASAQHPKLDALRAEGYEALYNLDYETARARFKKMIELAPDDPAGAQCYALSLWVQQLNEAWKLKATLYSDNSKDNESRVDRKQSERSEEH